MKKVLVAWSGGLDSTALVNDYLEKGWAVDAVYIDMHNNEAKLNREKLAIKSMAYEYFNKKFPGQLSRYDIASFMFRGLGSGASEVVLEAPVWLLYLLLTVNPRDHDEVALGWVLNDTALGFLPEYQKVWEVYGGLHPRGLPPLVFPIRKRDKRFLWEGLPPQLKERISWCRRIELNPHPCGKCVSCKRMSEATGQVYGQNQ